MEREADVALTTLEAAFNAHDARAVADAFTPDGWSVDVAGRRARGRADLLRAPELAFAGPIGDQRVRYVPRAAIDLADGIVLAQIDLLAVGVDGRPADVGHTATALHVLVRSEGRWLVAARQVTVTATDPGSDQPAASRS